MGKRLSQADKQEVVQYHRLQSIRDPLHKQVDTIRHFSDKFSITKSSFNRWLLEDNQLAKLAKPRRVGGVNPKGQRSGGMKPGSSGDRIEKEGEQEQSEPEQSEQSEPEQSEQDQSEQDQSEQDQSEQSELEQREQLEQEQLEQEQLEQEQLEQEQLEQEQLEQEQLEQEQLEQEQLESEQLESEQIEQEQIEQVQNEKEQNEQKQIEQEQNEQAPIQAPAQAPVQAPVHIQSEKVQRQARRQIHIENTLQKDISVDVNNDTPSISQNPSPNNKPSQSTEKMPPRKRTVKRVRYHEPDFEDEIREGTKHGEERLSMILSMLSESYFLERHMGREPYYDKFRLKSLIGDIKRKQRISIPFKSQRISELLNLQQLDQLWKQQFDIESNHLSLSKETVRLRKAFKGYHYDNVYQYTESSIDVNDLIEYVTPGINTRDEKNLTFGITYNYSGTEIFPPTVVSNFSDMADRNRNGYGSNYLLKNHLKELNDHFVAKGKRVLVILRRSPSTLMLNDLSNISIFYNSYPMLPSDFGIQPMFVKNIKMHMLDFIVKGLSANLLPEVVRIATKNLGLRIQKDIIYKKFFRHCVKLSTNSRNYTNLGNLMRLGLDTEYFQYSRSKNYLFLNREEIFLSNWTKVIHLGVLNVLDQVIHKIPVLQNVWDANLIDTRRPKPVYNHQEVGNKLPEFVELRDKLRHHPSVHEQTVELFDQFFDSFYQDITGVTQAYGPRKYKLDYSSEESDDEPVGLSEDDDLLSNNYSSMNSQTFERGSVSRSDWMNNEVDMEESPDPSVIAEAEAATYPFGTNDFSDTAVPLSPQAVPVSMNDDNATISSGPVPETLGNEEIQRLIGAQMEEDEDPSSPVFTSTVSPSIQPVIQAIRLGLEKNEDEDRNNNSTIRVIRNGGQLRRHSSSSTRPHGRLHNSTSIRTNGPRIQSRIQSTRPSNSQSSIVYTVRSESEEEDNAVTVGPEQGDTTMTDNMEEV